MDLEHGQPAIARRLGPETGGDFIDDNSDYRTVARRLGTPPLHFLCDDSLANDVVVFELTDGIDDTGKLAGGFVFYAKEYPQNELEALHEDVRAIGDGSGGIASYENVVAFKGLARATEQIFPITFNELKAMGRITRHTRAPRAHPIQL